MLPTSLLATLCVGTAAVYAQSSSNSIPPDQLLELLFNDGARRIHAPGALMHPGHMSDAPNVSTPSYPSPLTSQGLLIMLDLDTPFQNARVPTLHWLASVSLSTSASSPNPPPSPDTPANLTIATTHTPYLGPDPPVGDIAHTYAFYLFAPVSAAVSIRAPEQRTPFDWDAFLRASGLSEGSLVARNHFQVRNLSGHPTAAAWPSARPSETAAPTVSRTGLAGVPGATEVAFEGGAVGRAGRDGRMVMVGWMGLFVGLVVGL